MNKFSTIILSAVIGAVAAYVTVKLTVPHASSPAAEEMKESVYERVMRTQTLRCGYINYPPHIIVEPGTMKISGVMHDIVEEAARLLNLKVEWTEELGWGSTVTAIENNRVDAVCTSFWQNPVEGRYLGFSMPLFYSAVGAYVRADDNRFNETLSAIDSPDIKISASDGNISFLIAGQDYPKATVASLPNMTDETMQLTDIQAGKADVTFIETYLGEKYNAQNGNMLKNLSAENPLRLFGNTIALPNNDIRFKNMIDSAFVQLLYGGFVDKILDKYEEVPNGIYRVSKPFRPYENK